MGRVESKHRMVHRVLGLVVIVVSLFVSISGIVLNHREFFAGYDISRNFLPDDYSYENGRQASLRGGLVAGDDGELILFGDAGVWQQKDGVFEPMNTGFPVGADNRKIYNIIRYKGKLVAATHFGLWIFEDDSWHKSQALESERFVDLFLQGTQLAVMSRSNVYLTSDLERFHVLDLPRPENAENKVSLFTTLWQIHSGEIVGLGGKIFVDFLGLVVIFLSLTGLIRFYLFKRLKSFGKNSPFLGVFRHNKKWHTSLGIYLGGFLILSALTGLFLRPPLLIPIAGKNVPIIPGSNLDQPNFWEDRLRKGVWDERESALVFSTKTGMYRYKEGVVQSYSNQPPVSVMGSTVLNKLDPGEYLIGSFSGLFFWQLETGVVYNVVTGRPHLGEDTGRPISDYMVTGIVGDQLAYFVDYRQGIVELSGNQPIVLPDSFVDDARISLWNLALEIHTGRIFKALLGGFYILYVPFVGFSFIIVFITGYFWYCTRGRRVYCYKKEKS